MPYHDMSHLKLTGPPRDYDRTLRNVSYISGALALIVIAFVVFTPLITYISQPVMAVAKDTTRPL